MKRYALIVAAGTGTRMNCRLPKQFLLLNGKPVLFYSLAAFAQNNANTKILLVLSEFEVERWKALCIQHEMHIPHQIIIGGSTRTESVRNGLDAIDNGLVAIHDGARPLISNEIIEKCFVASEAFGSGVASVKPKDSIRLVKGDGSRFVDRETLRLVQTPQTFRVEIIKSAFDICKDQTATDDASMAEMAGFEIHLVEGSYFNFKITTPEDLVLAEILMKSNNLG